MRDVTYDAYCKTSESKELSALERTSIIIDNLLDTIAVGEEIRGVIGSAAKGRAIFHFIAEEDVFRFEQFIYRAAPYDRMNTMEVGLRGAGRFSLAVVCRKNVFGKDAVVMTCFKEKIESLMTDGALYMLHGDLFAADAKEKIAEAKRLLGLFAEDHPSEAKLLGDLFDEAARQSLISDMISRIVTGVSDRSNYDVCALARQAAEYTNSALGSDLVCAVNGETHDFTGTVSVPPEHMWYLLTTALAASVSISETDKAILEVRIDGNDLTLCFRSPNASLSGFLPEKMKIGEMKELAPGSALRLYLCELVCDRNNIPSEVICRDGAISLCLRIPMILNERRFHYEEEFAVMPEWLALTDAVVMRA